MDLLHHYHIKYEINHEIITGIILRWEGGQYYCRADDGRQHCVSPCQVYLIW